MRGRVGGVIMIRPVSLGLLLTDDPAELRTAVRQLTSTWGGIHTPLFAPADQAKVRATADGLDLDALVCVGNPPHAELAAAPGYQWYGTQRWGPYAPPDSSMNARLLDTQWLLGRLSPGNQTVLPLWTESDPLADLFTVWFGQFGDSAFESSLRSSFLRQGRPYNIPLSDPLIVPRGITPIALTAHDIQYSGLPSFCGFLQLDPAKADHLRLLWNLRATGATVFPWPLRHSARMRPAATSWLRTQLNSGGFTRSTGAGATTVQYADVILIDDDPDPCPELDAVLREAGISPRRTPPFLPRGWQGYHPLTTSFQRTFDVSFDRREWGMATALPDFVPALRNDPVRGQMTVAAHIEFFGEATLGYHRWCTVPNLRTLAPLIPGTDFMSRVRRPMSSGRVSSVPVSADELPIRLVQAMPVVALIFQGSAWEIQQSDSGLFAGRLADILGGPGTAVANEPAIREALTAAVRSPNGQTISQLKGKAKAHRGNWPTPIAYNPDPNAYVETVLQRLLYARLLLPRLTLRCPDCAVQMTLTPTDLSETFTCEMCSASYPLGYALVVAGSGASWHYRLPAHVGEERLVEALALVATAGALTMPGLPNRSLHQFGVVLSKPKIARHPGEQFCEIDLFLSSEQTSQPEIVIGEVKNQGWLEQADLDNLATVQQWFLRQGQHCYVLFATPRRSLSAQETAMLRVTCEQSPRSLGNLVEPLFPIVLVHDNLSVAPLEEAHPTLWRSPGGSMSEIAVESCRRNLGLTTHSLCQPAESRRWACQWHDGPDPPQSDAGAAVSQSTSLP